MKAKKIFESLSYEDYKILHPEWNWEEAENEVSNEDLEAAAEYYDRMKNQELEEAYEPKDLKRVKDFRKKSGGDFEKEVALARQMANTLTNVNKAIGRAEAAFEVYGGWNDIVQIFYDKAKELGYIGPEPGKRLDAGIVLGSKLPKSQQYQKPHRREERHSYYSYNRRGRFQGNPILPLGKVDLRTGECDYFNVYNTWENDDTTVEVWRDNKGIDTSHLNLANMPEEQPKLGGIVDILKPKPREEIELNKRKYFNYHLIFTSGKQPLYEIGEIESFYHVQNGNHIGIWEMVDYVSLKHMRELILPYGGYISGYVYK